jgi:RNA polymerase sigma factor (sigma-70 family)
MNQYMNQSSVTYWSTQIQVDQWRQGDPDALGRLADRFSPLVRFRIQGSRTFGRLKDHLTVEDIEQELWARVLKSGAEAFEARGIPHGFVAWLGQLTDSTMVDLLRGIEREKRGGGQQPHALDTMAQAQQLRRPGQRSEVSPTAEARIAEFEELAREVLSERELKAWMWVVLENYTSAEAALGLDTTPAAVRSLLVRSRSKLQSALESRKKRRPEE